jgi:hypothetical protein
MQEKPAFEGGLLFVMKIVRWPDCHSEVIVIPKSRALFARGEESLWPAPSKGVAIRRFADDKIRSWTRHFRSVAAT